MAAAKKKAAAKTSKGSALGKAQTAGVATAADVAVAAGLPATARSVDASVSINVVNLLRDPALATSLRANAAAIDEEGAGDVEDILGRIPDFVARYDTNARLAVSYGRVHESLVRDNADFARFATAAVSVYNNAGKLSPLKGDAALKKLAANRDIQRGQPKKARTLAKKARAKKGGPTKSS